MSEQFIQDVRDASMGGIGSLSERFRQLSVKYDGMTPNAIMDAFTRAGGGAMMNNPYIQNRRVKSVYTTPDDFSKDEVAEMIQKPEGNERALRSVEHGLEYTAYPLKHMRMVYQNLLTYHTSITPLYVEAADAKTKEFRREWQMLEKVRHTLKPKMWAHQIVGQTMQEGKVFYYPRVSVDKSHNTVNHAFMQQLPSDWTKIVGYNNISKYTVAFNMMYFMQPGCAVEQFGDLFDPYIGLFEELTNAPSGVGKKRVYNAKASVDLYRLNSMKLNESEKPDVYYQNGRWYYWVTLPIDKAWTFEADDTNATVVSPFTGLFISLIQIAQYEQVQLELVQNPLNACLVGSVPYRDDKVATTDDPYKMSYTGIQFFENLWYQMCNQFNTGGIGSYFAPFEDLKLLELSEAPSATNISGAGYSYTMAKAGMSAIIPSSDDPRVGLATISLQIESRAAQLIYDTFERMMECLFDGMNLRYEWRFRMFGDISSDKDEMENARKGMTLGILPDTIKYLALNDISPLEDMSVSNAIMGLGVLDNRIPLVSSYSAKQETSGLPPQAAHEINPGGRPASEGATSGGKETDIDQGKTDL